MVSLNISTTPAPQVSSSRSFAEAFGKRAAYFKHLAVELGVNHPRRAAVLSCLVGLNLLLPLGLLGRLNKRFGFMHSVFLCYPASTRFAKHYIFDFMVRHLKWRAMVYGVFVQGGKLGVLALTTTTEAEFARRAHAEDLGALKARVQKLQQRLGVPQVNYAGILPHYMGAGGAQPGLDQTSETIARLLCDAYDQVGQSEERGELPVIVLGGMGAIGKHLVDLLRQRGVETYCVDQKQEHDEWPKHLEGQDCMLIDVARKGARAAYVDRCWSEMILLNETYPEPRGSSLKRLKQVGMPVYHIVGVRGRAVPDFPDGYRGAVPCCAMHQGPGAEVQVKAL